MRKLLIAMALAVNAFAVGTVTQTGPTRITTGTGGAQNVLYKITLAVVADASAGTVPATVLNRSSSDLSNTDGLSIISVTTDPGSTAPTDNWDLTFTDSETLDLMQSGCLNRDTSTTESCSANPTPLSGNITMNITNNSVNSATITVVVYFSNQTVAKRSGATLTATSPIVITSNDISCPTCSVGGPDTVTAAGTLTANLPVIGAGLKAVAVGTRSGNTTAYVTTTGTQTSGRCVEIDASGNHIAAAAACAAVLATAAQSSNFNFTTTYIILCDATGGTVTGSLPDATTAGNGTQYTMKKTDASANSCTFDAAGADTIDGAGTLANTTQWQSFTIVSNGADWLVI